MNLEVAGKHTAISSVISIVSESGASREKGGHEGHMGQKDQEAQGSHREQWLGQVGLDRREIKATCSYPESKRLY